MGRKKIVICEYVNPEKNEYILREENLPVLPVISEEAIVHGTTEELPPINRLGFSFKDQMDMVMKKYEFAQNLINLLYSREVVEEMVKSYIKIENKVNENFPSLHHLYTYQQNDIMKEVYEKYFFTYHLYLFVPGFGMWESGRVKQKYLPPSDDEDYPGQLQGFWLIGRYFSMNPESCLKKIAHQTICGTTYSRHYSVPYPPISKVKVSDLNLKLEELVEEE
ncbi:hypothetical protein COT07_03340 [Candidatus Woesearchaeota archaeon CG07_land_8_20_14_0_80_44_23]|nr:MAG: hypothetical protein COT07_03340 [Candidatus Woesearchaeota archaeon CG07_land_8_20_14_0_80_44_23]